MCSIQILKKARLSARGGVQPCFTPLGSDSEEDPLKRGGASVPGITALRALSRGVGAQGRGEG
jgi:hypothetical protein